MEATKAYPYYMNASMQSQINTSMHPSSINTPGSYMGMGGSNGVNIPYNQIRNTPKPVTNITNGYPYGIPSYVPQSYVPSMIPPQYMGGYPSSMPNMLGGFNQFPQQYPQQYNF